MSYGPHTHHSPAGSAGKELGQKRPPELLLSQVEALLIAAEGPLSPARIAQLCQVSEREASAGIAELEQEYAGYRGGRRHGFEILETASGWRLRAREEHLDILAPALPAPPKLSRAALETLAIIAYRQPATRAQVAQLRGVSPDSAIRSLLAKELITELPPLAEGSSGSDESKNTAREGVEGAASYVLSARCLERLGVDSVQDLPPLAPLLPEPHDTERLDSALESVDPAA